MQAFVILAVVVIIIISSAKKNQQQAQQQARQRQARQRQANQYLDRASGAARPQRAEAGCCPAAGLEGAAAGGSAAAAGSPNVCARGSDAPTVPPPPPTMTHRMAKQPLLPGAERRHRRGPLDSGRHYQGHGVAGGGGTARPTAPAPEHRGGGVPSQMGPAAPRAAGSAQRPSRRSPRRPRPVYDAARLREAIVAMEVFGAPAAGKSGSPVE